MRVLTYIGFDGISTMSEEVENPRRNILLATVITCFAIGVLSADFQNAKVPTHKLAKRLRRLIIRRVCLKDNSILLQNGFAEMHGLVWLVVLDSVVAELNAGLHNHADPRRPTPLMCRSPFALAASFFFIY